MSTPCKNICKYDKTDTYCIGCYRTINEIAQWMIFSEEKRIEIMRLLPGRKKDLSSQ
ncbi:MAG: DUF1289 domain-containing protein [SAR202 cluster bacterium]|nr:DUF1289 domain-containing protein [Chloroflexota bacterium]MQG51897.1 DUF1289 domain-containing protein [SAR202 cluster bacterium]